MYKAVTSAVLAAYLLWQAGYAIAQPIPQAMKRLEERVKGISSAPEIGRVPEAQAPDIQVRESIRRKPVRKTSETVGELMFGICGAALGGFLGAGIGSSVEYPMTGMKVGYCLGSITGVCLTGKALKDDGSFVGALLGALACSVRILTHGDIFFLLSPLGATIGYGLSRRPNKAGPRGFTMDLTGDMELVGTYHYNKGACPFTCLDSGLAILEHKTTQKGKHVARLTSGIPYPAIRMPSLASLMSPCFTDKGFPGPPGDACGDNTHIYGCNSYFVIAQTEDQAEIVLDPDKLDEKKYNGSAYYLFHGLGAPSPQNDYQAEILYKLEMDATILGVDEFNNTIDPCGQGCFPLEPTAVRWEVTLENFVLSRRTGGKKKDLACEGPLSGLKAVVTITPL